MARDYQKEASDYEDEIRSLYPKGDEPDLTPDDNNDLSLDANESNQDDMTGVDESVPQEPVSEETVPKSQYDAALSGMNKSQREAAELRKRVAELEQQLSTQSTAQSQEEATESEDEMSFDDFEEENLEMPVDKQDFESLITELDDVGLGDFVPVLRLLKAENDKLKEQISKLGNVADDYIGYRKQLHTDAFWNTIREAHPDIQSFIPPSDAEYENYTPEQKQYADWYAEQDQETKDLFASTDPAVVIEGLNKFRADVPNAENSLEMEEEAAPSVAVVVAEKPQSPSKLEQAKAADSPNMKTENNGKPVKNRKFTRDEVANMSQKEYDDNEEAILSAMKRGEI